MTDIWSSGRSSLVKLRAASLISLRLFRVLMLVSTSNTSLKGASTGKNVEMSWRTPFSKDRKIVSRQGGDVVSVFVYHGDVQHHQVHIHFQTERPVFVLWTSRCRAVSGQR